MQEDRSADAARVTGSVRGLGVCDVLRVELEPVQWSGLERGMAERIAELERRQDELRREGGVAEHDALTRTREVLRLLTRMKAAPGRSVVTGPADLVAELVDTCLSDAVARVSERLTSAGGGSPRCSAWMDELEAAGAWIATALECAAVTDYCFEPGLDPVRW